MREATSPTTPPAAPPPSSIQLIDLTDHPDRELLQLCSALAKTRDAIGRLEHAISRTPSHTIDGALAKGLAL